MSISTETGFKAFKNKTFISKVSNVLLNNLILRKVIKKMVRQVGIIPKAPVARILMSCGAKRVSAEAVDAFVDVIGDIAEQISERAVQIARHSGRKTIQEGDVKLSAKQ